jgi:hypothetical protein
MNIDQLIALLTEYREELGGNAEVRRLNRWGLSIVGQSSKLNVAWQG